MTNSGKIYIPIKSIDKDGTERVIMMEKGDVKARDSVKKKEASPDEKTEE
jgi:hypothetical protein